MSLVTIDFETYYAADFSLSKMTTEAYIRDPRFQVIGFAYRIDDGDIKWVTGNDISPVLVSLELEQHRVVMHNAAFDGAILAWRFDIHPKLMIDTLSMAKPVTMMTVGGSLAALAKLFHLGVKGTEVVQALGKRREEFTPADLAQYGEYCKNDVQLTHALYQVLMQFSTPQEMYIIDLLLRMYTDPVIPLLAAPLNRHLAEVQSRKAKLLAQVDAAFGKDAIMSNPQFAAILVKLGVAPPMKTSAKTNAEAYAFAKTDPEFKALLEHPDLRVQAVMAARFGLKSTLEETRTEAFLRISSRGMLPIMIVYYAAHTGRGGGGDKINLQNLPRGGQLRYAMSAPDGHSMVAGDSSQIEARIVAWLAGQHDLVADFAAGIDIYSKFATKIFGFDVDKKSFPLERQAGKTGILGLGFGMGPDRFKDKLKSDTPSVDMAREKCADVVDLYRSDFPAIKKLWDSGGDALRAMSRQQGYTLGVSMQLLCDKEGVHLPNGMILRYPGLRWDNESHNYLYDGRYGHVKIYGAKLIENIVQALARIVVFNQMAKIDVSLKKLDRRDLGLRFKIALTVHDEVVAVVPEAMELKAVAMFQRVMSIGPSWAPGLPIACEVKSGTNYGQCK
jgi:DNA polymerase I-like protein with 3'-5' exonuclease and polymerase domains